MSSGPALEAHAKESNGRTTCESLRHVTNIPNSTLCKETLFPIGTAGGEIGCYVNPLQVHLIQVIHQYNEQYLLKC